ncbi:exonuclease domain-containing protein [Microbacterium sp. NPDC057650]|uniref:exonuclease domain-containing protein n=1 Tax=unclassified Microbacterium TaxID=2609290 RepID=UPI00366D8617
MGYAVIDLETTGFSPARGDRIVEIGVVLLDEAGNVEDEWTTLVNPQRDVGPTHVHGIHASDVVDAPLFGDVAAQLVGLLSGRTLAAHNQEFDLRFLRAELAAHGYMLPAEYSALCTMLWSRASFGAAKLNDVCSVLSIEHGSAHAALGDARATGAVIAVLIRERGHSRQWESDALRAIFPLASDGLPAKQNSPRAAIGTATPMAFIDTASLPLWERVSITLDTSDAAAAVYLDMLARVLEDGLISTMEYSRLEAIAEVAHLSAGRINELHAAYLEAATAEALADGTVTADEKRELEQIATILDLPAPEIPVPIPVARAIPAEKMRGDAPGPIAATGASFTLVLGARIVFTGTMSRPREAWAYAIADAGFVTGSVTKNCVVLVAEDPMSQSGKAKTARAHGIPIVTEAEFITAFDAFILQHGLAAG